jgi:hypothetical protein
MSCTSFEGFGYTLAELIGGCDDDDDDDVLPVPGNLDIAWRCLAPSNSFAGRAGYNRSEGAG